ncbi:hypothetical protein HDV00_009283 [Rhizophlyctis rosea]|nr:hypothetical protein HDV00_009283 [Rhizophlyctis rosea]
MDPQVCPVDRFPLSHDQLVPTFKILENIVNELFVFCPQKRRGCGWTGQRQFARTHLDDECQFVRVRCKASECGTWVLRRQLPVHTQNCRHCVKDGEDVEGLAGTATDCVHQGRGCKWHGTLGESTDHLLHCPFEALKDVVDAQENRFKEVEDKNQELERRLETLQAEMDNLKAIFSSIPHDWERILANTLHYQTELNNINATIGALEVKQDMAVMTESARIRDELQSVRALCQGLQMQLVTYVLDKRKDLSSLASGSKSIASAAVAAINALGSRSSASTVVDSSPEHHGRVGSSRPDSRPDATTKL